MHSMGTNGLQRNPAVKELKLRRKCNCNKYKSDQLRLNKLFKIFIRHVRLLINFFYSEKNGSKTCKQNIVAFEQIIDFL